MHCVCPCARTCLCWCNRKIKKRKYLCEHTGENNKASGRENVPDGNAAVQGDVDSRPSKGKPAGGGQTFFPLGLHSLTGKISGQTDRQTDQKTEHRCVIGSKAKAKGTAASYRCSPASPLP